MLAALIILALLTYLIYYCFGQSWKKRKIKGCPLPPSPNWKVPVLGHALHLGKDQLAGAKKLRKE